MKKILIATLLPSLFGIGTAFAQSQASETAVQPAPQVRYQQTTRYDFDNDEVEGTFAHPDGIGVDSVRKSRQTSLVKPRQSFTPEMVKSVEEL